MQCSLTQLTRDIWKIFQECAFHSLKKLRLENSCESDEDSEDGKDMRNKDLKYSLEGIFTENKDGTEQFSFERNCFQVIRSRCKEKDNDEDDDHESAQEESEIDENTDRDDSFAHSHVQDRSVTSQERSGTNLNFGSGTQPGALSNTPPSKDDPVLSTHKVGPKLLI